MSEQVVADRYVLRGVIGRGATADVHRATDRLLDREVALKLLRPTTGLGRERERFRSEISVLGRLNHPGLVSVYDAGLSDAHAFVVMELVEGPTLRELMDAGPMRPARVAEIGSQLAASLAYAHSQGVVHRDVKPSNVLMDRVGRAKLADFGIARVLGDTVHHTQTGFAVGTAAYLSPEQLRGEEVTGSADVYALGLVLLEALTGERAYPGASAEAAFTRLHRLPELPVSLSRTWLRLLGAMTATTPERRPGAADVATELGLPAVAMPPAPTRLMPTAAAASSSPRLPSWSLAAAAGVAGLAVVLAVARLVPGDDPAPATGNRSPSPSAPAVTRPGDPAASPVAAEGEQSVSTPAADPPPATDQGTGPGRSKKEKPEKAPKGSKGSKKR